MILDAADQMMDPSPARPPRLRFAFGAAFWRIAAGVFLVREALIWLKVNRVAPGVELPLRLKYVLLRTPESFFVAFASAAVSAVILDQIVRHLTGPRVARWLSPRTDDAQGWPLSFLLEATERVEASWPARRAVGRSWVPGMLVVTDRRIGFFPRAWDREPFWIPRAGIGRALGREPAPSMSWGFVTGLPDRIACRAGGTSEVFAVLEPDQVLRRLGAPDGGRS